MDSVFIFQSFAEETPSASYDAIVVEQWTVVDVRISVFLSSVTRGKGVCPHDSLPPPPKGVVVKADYVPLLQSLAPYGWRLMCVLPTPIVKTNRYRSTAANACARNENTTFF